MNAYLFINPTSGHYADHRVAEICTGLEAAGITVTTYVVRTPAEAQRCCHEMYFYEPRPLAVVAAGDGTINAVLNGLYPGSATLAVLPLGTSNVLAAELGISSLTDGLGRIIRGKTRPLSAARIRHENCSKLFTLMTGVGFDGAVVRDVSGREKRFIHQGAYLLSALRNLRMLETETLEVIVDHRTITCHTAVVCNASRYGGNIMLAPETDIFTPGLEVICVQGCRRRDVLSGIFKLVRGGSDNNGHLQRFICQEMEIRGRKPVQIDGDFAGYSPATFEVVTDVCRIIV